MMFNKLTKNEIFRLAHKYAKRLEGDYSARFAWALKYVYKCIKLIDTKVELKGSPKQIKWANEIRDNFEYRNLLFENFINYKEEYVGFDQKIEFIKLFNMTENSGVIICMAYESPMEWFHFIQEYKRGKYRTVEIGKEYNPNYFVIDDKGRFLQCDFSGTVLNRRQYYDFK